jgi:hypothetical protein
MRIRIESEKGRVYTVDYNETTQSHKKKSYR